MCWFKAKWGLAQKDIGVRRDRPCCGSLRNRVGVRPDAPQSSSVEIPRSGHRIEQTAHEPEKLGPVSAILVADVVGHAYTKGFRLRVGQMRISRAGLNLAPS